MSEKPKCFGNYKESYIFNIAGKTEEDCDRCEFKKECKKEHKEFLKHLWSLHKDLERFNKKMEELIELKKKLDEQLKEVMKNNE
jgi:hypothetical protein